MHKKLKSKASPARKLALEIVYQVMEKGSYAQVELDRSLNASIASDEDRRLAAEISQGAIRMKSRLDWYLNRHLTRPLEKQNPWLRTIMRISAYQLLFLDRIPAYACINDAVSLTREVVAPALGGLTNAVLRKIALEAKEDLQPSWSGPEEEIAVWQSLPVWIVALLAGRWGVEETRRIAHYFNTNPPQYLRVNRLQCTRESLLQSLRLEGVEAIPSPRHPDSVLVSSGFQHYQDLAAWKEGAFYIHNEASMLAGSILQPRAGERILDLCCGAGGKSSHLAEISGDQAQIRAVDLHAWKISALAATLSRLGLTCVQGQARDVLELPEDTRVQAILLDAPCSGLGVMGRRPDLRWRLEPAAMTELQELQSRLLARSAGLLARGGRILYVTCTLNYAENEGIITDFLKKHEDFKLEGFAGQLDFMKLRAEDAAACEQGMFTLVPGRYNTDGMFYALMRRNG